MRSLLSEALLPARWLSRRSNLEEQQEQLEQLEDELQDAKDMARVALSEDEYLDCNDLFHENQQLKRELAEQEQLIQQMREQRAELLKKFV